MSESQCSRCTPGNQCDGCEIVDLRAKNERLRQTLEHEKNTNDMHCKAAENLRQELETYKHKAAALDAVAQDDRRERNRALVALKECVGHTAYAHVEKGVIDTLDTLWPNWRIEERP